METNPLTPAMASRLKDDLQQIHDGLMDAYRYGDVGDHDTVMDMLAWQLDALRALADRLGIPLDTEAVDTDDAGA